MLTPKSYVKTSITNNYGVAGFLDVEREEQTFQSHSRPDLVSYPKDPSRKAMIILENLLSLGTSICILSPGSVVPIMAA